MKSKYILFALLLAVATSFVSCDEDGWLQRDPKDRITDEQLWNDPNMILGLLAKHLSSRCHKESSPGQSLHNLLFPGADFAVTGHLQSSSSDFIRKYGL